MKLTATAIAFVLLVPAPAQAASITGSGGASVPPRPHTGGAPAIAPVRPVPEVEARRPEAAPPAATPAAGDDGRPAGPSTAASEPAAVADDARGTAADDARAGDTRVVVQEAPDTDVEVPVPEDEPRPDAQPAPPTAADDASSLPRAGLDVVPLTAIGLAMLLAGLTALRLLSRRPG